jgi:hypothetical protein
VRCRSGYASNANQPPEASVDILSNYDISLRLEWLHLIDDVVVWRASVGVRCRRGSLKEVGPTTPAIKLEGDQLGELGRDVCHRIFCSTQAASRAEQGADFAESLVGTIAALKR